MQDLKNEIKMRFSAIEDNIKLIKILENFNFSSENVKDADKYMKKMDKNMRDLLVSSLLPHLKWWIIIYLYWILEYSIWMSINLILNALKEQDINLLSLEMKTAIVSWFSRNTNKYKFNTLKDAIEKWVEDNVLSDFENLNKWIIENWWENLTISEKINFKDDNGNLYSIKWNMWVKEISKISSFFWWRTNFTNSECKNIDMVKQFRNQLCHWEKTFSDVGWSLLVQEISNMKTLLKTSINKYLKKVESFLSNKDYLQQ